jgi:hypothetical protein
MVATSDYLSGIMLLPTTPFPGRNDSKWYWSTQQWQPPWLVGESGAHLVSVLCADLCGHHCRHPRKQEMMSFSSFKYVALFHCMLATISTPRSRGWSTMAVVGRHQPPWCLVFHQLRACVCILCGKQYKSTFLCEC